MGFFDNVYDKLFGKRKGGEMSTIPLYSEPLKRGLSFERNYFKWLNGGDSLLFQSQVLDNYEEKSKGVPNKMVHLLNTPYANGIAISQLAGMNLNTLKFLMDLLKVKILKHGYFLYTADNTIYEKNNYIETVERYYLKPSRKEKDGKMDQRYGNILIEHISINDEPSYLKLLVTIYSDRAYTSAKAFKEFMTETFG